MRIIVYAPTGDPGPIGPPVIARILLAPGDWHPVLFTAADPETARANAQAWWDSELAKAQRPKGPPRKAVPQGAEDLV